jgi:hypothetical protein
VLFRKGRADLGHAIVSAGLTDLSAALALEQFEAFPGRAFADEVFGEMAMATRSSEDFVRDAVFPGFSAGLRRVKAIGHTGIEWAHLHMRKVKIQDVPAGDSPRALGGRLKHGNFALAIRVKRFGTRIVFPREHEGKASVGASAMEKHRFAGRQMGPAENVERLYRGEEARAFRRCSREGNS